MSKLNLSYAMLLLLGSSLAISGAISEISPKKPKAETKVEAQSKFEPATEQKPDVSPQTSLYLSSQPYVVSIEIRTTDAAYSTPGTSFGTGSILDKEQGVILTNAHVVVTDGIADHYDITLHDGTVTKAKLLYSDPWHDFALLQTDPASLKSIPHSLPTQRNAVNIGEPVLIIGKNENKHFSMQDGTIATPFEVTDLLPSQAFRISLNAQGGASGSPVINSQGKVIGIVYASNQTTSAFAIPIDYALDALDAIKQDKKPKRFGTGVIFQLTTLDDLMRYDSFSPDIAKDYQQKFPNAFARTLTVKMCLAGSPSESVLQVGDVILKVNGKDVGSSLYQVDKIINEENEKNKAEVTFDIIRHGKALQVKSKTYDLNSRVISRMISFGKAIFYETNDEITQKTGAPHGVFVTNLKPGGGFYDVIPSLPGKGGYAKGLVAITSIQDKPIKTLDDLEKIIPSLMKQNDFHFTIRNFGTEFGYNGDLYFSHQEQQKYVSYYASDGLSEVYSFDDKNKNWNVKTIS